MNDTPSDTTDDQEPETLPSEDEQVDELLEQSGLKEQQKKARGKKLKYGGAAVGVVLIGFIIQWGLQSGQGGRGYGVCKVFLELYTRYPQTLYISYVESFETSTRLWYAQTDSFGQYRMEPLQCYFRQDPTYGLALEKVTLRRREVDPEIIERFNKSMGVVLQNLPDLTIPKPLPNSLRALQLDPNQYRKPVI